MKFATLALVKQLIYPRAIVVLIDFSNQPMKPGKVEQMRTFPLEGLNCVNQYYGEISGGMVSFDGEVMGYSNCR